jgi:CubicO group peptidase (beta-lactamase class C family)
MSPFTPAQVGCSAERLTRVSALIQRYIDEGKLPGVIATISRRGQTVYQEKFGWMDIEARKPMQFDAIFRIASMTKPITSVAAIMLYEEGHFNLNTPVYEFIPAFKDAKVFVRETENGPELADLERPITMRHLFTHTSGLSYGFNPADPVDKLYLQARQQREREETPETLQNAIEALARLPLAFQPGTHWRYSMSIDVLGYVIQVIAGMPYEQFLQERLLEPLGMVDTAFYVPPAKLDRLCGLYGHTPDQPGLHQVTWRPVYNEPPSHPNPGGGLFSTAHDYGRFAQMLVNGGELDGVRLLSPKTVALMEMNQAPAEALPYGFGKHDTYHTGYGYGLGMRVLMDVAANGLAGSVGEFGWDGAFNTYFWIDRKEALYGLLMMQHGPNGYYPIARQFKTVTYQALVN